MSKRLQNREGEKGNLGLTRKRKGWYVTISDNIKVYERE